MNTGAPLPHGRRPIGRDAPAPAVFGMWIFIAGEALFFGTLLFAYGVARWHAPEAFIAASARTDLLIGTVNTALLLTSSAAVALASEQLECDRPRSAARCLEVAACLGIAFLALKATEWHSEWMQGLFPGPVWTLDGHDAPAAELFFVWYFVATGLHAVHLAIGIVVALCLVRRGGPEGPMGAKTDNMHAFGLYWHFVDVVWIVLYPLIYLVAPRT